MQTEERLTGTGLRSGERGVKGAPRSTLPSLRVVLSARSGVFQTPKRLPESPIYHVV
jgi:hypothetical protein